MKITKYNSKIQLFIILHIGYMNCIIKTKISRRIVGGRLAERNEFEYVVRLDYQEDEFKGNQTFESYVPLCTGSALSPTWVLTAAHCLDVNGTILKNATFYVRYNHFLPEIVGKLSKALTFYEYENYRYQEFNWIFFARNDAGLVKSDKIVVSTYAKLSAIDYSTLYGQTAMAVGHGVTNITEGFFNIPLQVLTVMISKCTNDRNNGLDGSGVFCLNTPCGVVASTSKGDSGGPVIHSSGIIGVISMGAIEYSPKEKKLGISYFKASAGVITSVSPILDWISYKLTNQ